LHNRLTVESDIPEASSPNKPSSAGRKSPVESPRRYRIAAETGTTNRLEVKAQARAVTCTVSVGSG
jgi:hypothetical protein